MLPFHNQIVESLLRSDGLVVLGQGLSTHTVLLELIKRTCADADASRDAQLAFLINTPAEETEVLLKRVAIEAQWAGHVKLTVVGSELPADDRASLFARGGVFAVQARLLVTDFLAGKVLPEMISGIFVNHAHSVGDMSADAFVLRIFRTKNKRGFVRAVSDKPDAFSRGYSVVEKIMARLFLQRLELWPRIHSQVHDCLHHALQASLVSQHKIELPRQIRTVQDLILNIIEGTLEELRKTKGLDLGQLVARDSLFKAFEWELRQALDPVWLSIGPRTRRMVKDLGGVRRLLISLLRYNAAEFYGFCESLSTVADERDAPAWLLAPDAQALYQGAKARVFEIERLPEGCQLKRTMEPHGKWSILLEIMERSILELASSLPSQEVPSSLPSQELPNGLPSQEAPSGPLSPDAPRGNGLPSQEAPSGPPSPHAPSPHVFPKEELVAVDDSDSDLEVVAILEGPDVKRRKVDETPSTLKDSETPVQPGADIVEPRFLVVVPDEQVQRLVTSVLSRGIEATQLDSLQSFLHAQQERGKHKVIENSSTEAVLLRAEVKKVKDELENLVPKSLLTIRPLPDGRLCHPRIDVVSTSGAHGILELRLREVRPHVVLFFEPELASIRELEVYCASLPPEMKQRTKAHLLLFEDSVEKYKFQQSLVRESLAVDALIRTRQSLATRVDDVLAEAAAAATAAKVSSRRGGGVRGIEARVTQRVVVDMREFRSALPYMLYHRDLVVEPLTIPIGDYVLSRDICVERKSIPDLIQSLNSGRLHQQAQNLCQQYASPSLLIEFEPGKSFALQSEYSVARRGVGGPPDVISKVALLTLHFPKLRFIWSPSQRYTADIFIKLKEGRYQPDAQAALAGLNEDSEQVQGGPRKPNSAALEVLRKLPGVTPRNLYNIARHVKCLMDLAQMPEQELTVLMGAANARLLRGFLDKEAESRTLFGDRSANATTEQSEGSAIEIAEDANATTEKSEENEIQIENTGGANAVTGKSDDDSHLQGKIPRVHDDEKFPREEMQRRTDELNELMRAIEAKSERLEETKDVERKEIAIHSIED